MKQNSIIIFFMMLVACDPVDGKLTINNNSNQKIYYLRTPNNKLSTFYQDLAKQGLPVTYLNCVEEIDPHVIRPETILGLRNHAWKNYINNSEDGKLRIYTFSIDTLKKYPFKDVTDNERYLNKMEFSVDDLEKQNWEIQFK